MLITGNWLWCMLCEALYSQSYLLDLTFLITICPQMFLHPYQWRKMHPSLTEILLGPFMVTQDFCLIVLVCEPISTLLLWIPCWYFCNHILRIMPCHVCSLKEENSGSVLLSRRKNNLECYHIIKWYLSCLSVIICWINVIVILFKCDNFMSRRCEYNG